MKTKDVILSMSKRWFAEKFAEIADYYSGKGINVVLFGDEKDTGKTGFGDLNDSKKTFLVRLAYGISNSSVKKEIDAIAQDVVKRLRGITVASLLDRASDPDSRKKGNCHGHCSTSH